MPKLGEKGTCAQCGKPIQYVGPHWRHTASNPRHVAKPQPHQKPEEPKQAFVCIACEDTGKNSRGGACLPCLNNGRIKS